MIICLVQFVIYIDDSNAGFDRPCNEDALVRFASIHTAVVPVSVDTNTVIEVSPTTPPTHVSSFSVDHVIHFVVPVIIFYPCGVAPSSVLCDIEYDGRCVRDAFALDHVHHIKGPLLIDLFALIVIHTGVSPMRYCTPLKTMTDNLRWHVVCIAISHGPLFVHDRLVTNAECQQCGNSVAVIKLDTLVVCVLYVYVTLALLQKHVNYTAV